MHVIFLSVLVRIIKCLMLGKEMATHSSILAWKIPWTEKPGRLQSMGSAKSQTRLRDFKGSMVFAKEL